MVSFTFKERSSNFKFDRMKNKNLIIILGLIVASLLSACSSLSVNSDYDKTTDFTAFKTYSYYGWAENSDKILNRFDKERIEKAFGEELAKRGLEYVAEGGDLIVTLYIVTEQKQQTTATTTNMGGGYGGYYGYGPGYGYGGGMSTTNYNTYDYTVGTLVVDIYDASKKELIFESIGSGTVDENPKNRDKSIPTTVSAMMKPYPVKPIPTK